MADKTLDDYRLPGEEWYISDKDGRTHIRKPAGGAGGGVTSFADILAGDAQHFAFLQSEMDKKKAEGEALQQKHTEDHKAVEAKKAEEAKNNPDEEPAKPFAPKQILTPSQPAI